MSIPTQKEIEARKRTAKARVATHVKREAKRIAEGREPDNKATRKARKDKTTEHLAVQTRTRTEAEKQKRKADSSIKALQDQIKELSVIDPETLLDIIEQDKGNESRAQHIDLMKVLDLKKQGLTNVGIAKALGTTINRLRGLIKRYEGISSKIQSFKGHRADIFADFQRRILKSITDSDLHCSTVGSRLTALCNLYEKERLERDQSTANLFTLHDDVAAIKSQTPKPLAATVTAAVVLPAALPEPTRTG
jgi:hypothetical protein